MLTIQSNLSDIATTPMYSKNTKLEFTLKLKAENFAHKTVLVFTGNKNSTIITISVSHDYKHFIGIEIKTPTVLNVQFFSIRIKRDYPFFRIPTA